MTTKTRRPRSVALFASCMTDLAAPGPATAAVRVLEAMGFDVEVPRRQSCCGQPATNTGFPEAARPLLAAYDRTFRRFDAVVTPAGSCAAMLRRDVPGGTPNLWEFTQFVTAFGADLELHLDARVTYHDSCHMTRVLGERTTPRALLGMIAGLEVVEMEESTACCGFGGTFSVKFPELSAAMADVKLGHAAETRTHYLVSSDPGCLVHLSGRALAAGVPVVPRHIAELTADALVGVRV